LEGLGASFAALARFYARHHGPTKDADAAPRLFISKLENGSVIAEIVPYVVNAGPGRPFHISMSSTRLMTRTNCMAIPLMGDSHSGKPYAHAQAAPESRLTDGTRKSPQRRCG